MPTKYKALVLSSGKVVIQEIVLALRKIVF